ncbi:unnamed protein product [Ectocarpus sp. 8 AP-2014]
MLVRYVGEHGRLRGRRGWNVRHCLYWRRPGHFLRRSLFYQFVRIPGTRRQRTERALQASGYQWYNEQRRFHRDLEFYPVFEFCRDFTSYPDSEFYRDYPELEFYRDFRHRFRIDVQQWHRRHRVQGRLLRGQLRVVRRYRLFNCWQQRRVLLHEHNSGGRGSLRPRPLHCRRLQLVVWFVVWFVLWRLVVLHHLTDVSTKP